MTVCPKCSTEFAENEPWDAGNCPLCGKEYHWDAITIQDGDHWDELPIIEWRTWDEIRSLLYFLWWKDGCYRQ